MTYQIPDYVMDAYRAEADRMWERHIAGDGYFEGGARTMDARARVIRDLYERGIINDTVRDIMEERATFEDRLR